MNNHKATPQQWDKVEEWCSEMSSTDSCILELRARIKQLEAQVGNLKGSLTSSTLPPVATDEEPLSPAQAIVKAFDDRYELLGPLEDDWQEQCIAAALCALADQVVPHPGRYPMNEYMEGIRNAKHDVRKAILAIATELENHQ
jgi:hypothetical protein